MAASQTTRFLCVPALIALLGSSQARSQDPATKPAPAAPAPAPAPASTPADGTPEEVLKNLGLVRSGTTWVLPDEKTVLRDLRDARMLYDRVAQGMMRQQMLAYGTQNQQAVILQLRQRSAELNQSIAQLDAQLNNLVVPPGGNNFVQIQRQQVADQRNQLALAHNQIVNQLNTLQEQAQPKDPGDDPRLQLNAEVAQDREKYMQAVLDLRSSVDQVTEKYNAVAKNPQAAGALAALSASTKNRHKLGPSKAMLDAIKTLERVEGTVRSENITLHKEDGVFHVYATLNKVPTKMVFDTGAGITTISASLAKKIGLKPSPGDEAIQLKTADGTVITSKKTVIPTVRVGKFTISNVECAVMPENKGDVDPLLGGSFLKHFKFDFSPETGRLTLKKVETMEGESAAQEGAKAAAATKARAKSKAGGPRARPKTSSKARRGAKSRQPTPNDAGQPISGETEGGPG